MRNIPRLSTLRTILNLHPNFRLNVTAIASRNVDLDKSTTISRSMYYGHLRLQERTSRAKEIPVESSSGQTTEINLNPCNIQMIGDELFDQIFSDIERQRIFSDDLVGMCKKHLEGYGLWGQKVDKVNPVNFPLPLLEGLNIDEHFRNIALQQTHIYKTLLNKLINSEPPDFPKDWVFDAGWTKYNTDGSRTKVDFPEENALVFDVEVCMSNGQVPTLACAVSTDCWYSWCSPSLIEGTNRDPLAKVRYHELIPLETIEGNLVPPSGKWPERIVVGHNVSYDRARIKEQYFVEKTKMRFLDTMSLHIAISGITSFQRALKMTMKSRNKKGTAQSASTDVGSSLEWNEISSLNNMADVYKLYCNGAEVKKDERNIFVKGTLQDVRSDFQSLMLYCARDVKATHEIVQKVLPRFYDRFPHPVTFCGMLEMGTTFLPVNQNWNEYISKSDNAFTKSQNEVKSILMQKANEALTFLENEKYAEDPWLWDLDWKVTKSRTSKKSSSATVTHDSNPSIQYPAWYKKLMYKPTEKDFQPGPSKISSSMQVVPKLLRLTWFGFPLHHSKTGGWGFLVKKISADDPSILKANQDEMGGDLPESDNSESDVSKFPYKQWELIFEAGKENLIKNTRQNQSQSPTHLASLRDDLINKSESAVEDLTDFLKGLEAITGRSFTKKRNYYDNSGAVNSPHPKCEFIPLPHKNGINYRVGNPLGKDFLSKIEEGILSCQNGQDIADKVVKISKQSSYWRNNRDRILGQMTVWDDHSGKQDDTVLETGAIIPQVVVSGTLTRRAVEPTWMTASNAYVDRIGSELKSMVQAPPSFHFVGADVDSQELWLASIMGDAHFAGQHGCTALGWMTLQGTKTAGTDMHSKTAAVSGIAREQSKILNYARIYGAGVTFAERLLLQFNRNMSPTEAKLKAKAMYKMTKGDRKYILNDEGQQLASQLEEFHDRLTTPLSKSDLQNIMSYHHFPYKEYLTLVDKLVWDNGTESYMFNRLEEIAQEENPRTPVLGCLISRSLVPSVVQNDYMTSRINWVVQSSAVDYLHLMLTCMGWLIKRFDLKARFSLSVHDEVRYLVHSEDRYRVALALQITNLLTRSFCCYRFGMYDIPQSVAFFSCVDVDRVLRKEVTDDCITPSNPDGLKATYSIPEGEALDIWTTINLTNGTLLK